MLIASEFQEGEALEGHATLRPRGLIMPEALPISPPSSEEPDYLEIPEWHRKILEERMARYDFSIQGTRWEEFEQELTEG